VGLRDGKVVLDRDATTLKQDDVMDVYRRVDKTLDDSRDSISVAASRVQPMP
jgi:hypothetical protein